jgi:hypothetical protein
MKTQDDSTLKETISEETSGAEHMPRDMLQDFGSRKLMVREIHFDLDRAFPIPCAMHQVHPDPQNFPCDEAEHAFEMWSLLTAVLHLPNFRVEFVHAKRQAHYDFQPSTSAAGIDKGIQVERPQCDFSETTAGCYRYQEVREAGSMGLHSKRLLRGQCNIPVTSTHPNSRSVWTTFHDI